MPEEPQELGRRHLMLLGVAAAVAPACGGNVDASPINGPYRDGGGGAEGGGSESSGITFPRSSSQVTTEPFSSSAQGGSSSVGPTSSSGGGGSSVGSSGVPSSSQQATSSSVRSSSSSAPGCPTSGSTYTATFAAHPGLMTVGSGVTVAPPGYKDNYGNDAIFVVQQASGSYLAYSLSCTHAGCQVQPAGAGAWRCFCHGATFNATGAVTGGPARTNLRSYPVCADANGVTITLQ